MFSIVIPLFNKEDSIEKTIQSVLRQTFGGFEILVVNDWSTDSSLDRVHNISDSRIRILNNLKKGVSSARNLGVKNSRFDYICFLDADDIWLEHYLSELRKIVTAFNPEVICSGFATSFREKDPEKVYTLSIESGFYNYFELFKKFSYVVCSSSVCIQKELFFQVGGFDERFTHGEDMDLWEKLAIKCNLFYFFNQTCSIYILDSENRATGLRPSLGKRAVSEINFNEIQKQIEYDYFREKVLGFSFLFFRQFNYKDFFGIIRKYKGVIRPHEHFLFIVKRIIGKHRSYFFSKPKRNHSHHIGSP